MAISTFQLRIVFKVWNRHMWLHGRMPTSLAWFCYPISPSELWTVVCDVETFSWEDKSGFNNIEGFRDIKTCINENVTSVDRLAVFDFPLTSLEPPGLPSWWWCVVLNCWLGWNHDSVLIQSWAQSQGPVTLAKKTQVFQSVVKDEVSPTSGSSSLKRGVLILSFFSHYLSCSSLYMIMQFN